jgi:tetratricopeptide (TPR) repeat protein
MQIRYGKPQEAIAYLLTLRRVDPENRQALRLLASAFLKLERWSEAESVIESLEQLGGEPRVSLWRAITRFKMNRIAEAREWFDRFASLGTNE